MKYLSIYSVSEEELVAKVTLLIRVAMCTHIKTHKRQGDIVGKFCCNVSSSTLDGGVESLYCAATVQGKKFIHHVNIVIHNDV